MNYTEKKKEKRLEVNSPLDLIYSSSISWAAVYLQTVNQRNIWNDSSREVFVSYILVYTRNGDMMIWRVCVMWWTLLSKAPNVPKIHVQHGDPARTKLTMLQAPQRQAGHDLSMSVSETMCDSFFPVKQRGLYKAGWDILLNMTQWNSKTTQVWVRFKTVNLSMTSPKEEMLEKHNSLPLLYE